MKILRNQQGLSLIEILAAVAILGVLTTAVTTSIINMATNQKNIETRQNLSSLVNEIQSLTTNGSTCIQALGAGSQEFNAVAAQSADGMPFNINVNGEGVQSGYSSSKYGVRADRLLMVNGTLAGVDVSGQQVYKVQMVGAFQPMTAVAGLGGLSDFNLRVLGNVFLTIDGDNKIVSCAQQSPMEDRMAADYCRSFGGTYDAAGRRCNGLVDLGSPEAVRAICQATGQAFNANTVRCAPFVVAGNNNGDDDDDDDSSGRGRGRGRSGDSGSNSGSDNLGSNSGSNSGSSGSGGGGSNSGSGSSGGGNSGSGNSGSGK